MAFQQKQLAHPQFQTCQLQSINYKPALQHRQWVSSKQHICHSCCLLLHAPLSFSHARWSCVDSQQCTVPLIPSCSRIWSAAFVSKPSEQIKAARLHIVSYLHIFLLTPPSFSATVKSHAQRPYILRRIALTLARKNMVSARAKIRKNSTSVLPKMWKTP